MAPFKRKSHESTMAEADKQTLEVLELQGADLANPRSIRHYLYAKTEAESAPAVKRLEQEGFTVTSRAARDGGAWLILAERTEVVNASGVATSRVLFERLAASMQGGEYDGWEASVPEQSGPTPGG